MIEKIHIKLKSCLILVAMLLLAATPSFSQQQQDQIKVKGKVTDAKGEVLVGVSVLIKGTNAGTSTDGDGNYTLQAPATATLVFSYIGFDKQEIKVDPSGTVNVKLSGDKILDQVVVVGYGTSKKKDLTGGLAVIGKEQLNMVSTPNLMDRLVGQVAGLSITTGNAAPGQDQTLLIRGENSLSAPNNPLIVLDGIPYSGSLVDIDPNNVENLTILKDASAVAIYGARGSNGVILIQTKRGTLGKANVSYRGQIGFADPMQRIDVMGPNEFIRFKQDIGRLRSGYTGDQLDPIAGNILSVTERGNYAKGITNDWQDYIFKRGITMDHQVSISGGTESTKYLASAAALDQEGVVFNSRLKRLNLTANIDQTFNNWLTMGFGSQFSQRDDGGIQPNIEHAIKQSPYGAYKDAAGYYVAEPMEYSLIVNPMRNTNAIQDRLNRNFFLSTYANIILPIKGLSARSNFGYNYRSGFTGTYYGRDTFDGREQAGLVGGKASIGNSHYNDYTWENLLKYDRTFGNHRIDATGLFSMQETKSVSSSQSAEGFVTDQSSYYMMNTAARNIVNGSNLSETALLSYMGRLNYSFKGKYMFTVTGRTDGASVFGINNKYAFFPSAALAWRVTEENFMKGVPAISNLKLRTSYGATGNSEIPAYRALAGMRNYNVIFDGTRNIGIGIDRMANPNLQWEKTQQLDFGLELGLFSNRVNFELDLYRRKVNNMLLDAPLPLSSGYNSIFSNIGSMENKGLEFAVNATILKTENFSWNTTFNISVNKNKVLALSGGSDIYSGNGVIRVGEPVGSFFGRVHQGTWGTNEAEEAKKYNMLPGDVKYKDLNNDGTINDNDRDIIGKGIPDGFGTFLNTFQYKGISLTVDLQYMYGNDVLDRSIHSAEDRQGIANSYKTVLNAWTETNQNTPIAQIRPINAYYTTNNDSHKVTDGSFIRGRNLLLAYSFPAAFASRLKMERLRVYGSVQNFFVVTKYKGYDPEVSNSSAPFDQGLTLYDYPKPRVFMVGLNIGL